MCNSKKKKKLYLPFPQMHWNVPFCTSHFLLLWDMHTCTGKSTKLGHQILAQPFTRGPWCIFLGLGDWLKAPTDVPPFCPTDSRSLIRTDRPCDNSVRYMDNSYLRTPITMVRNNDRTHAVLLKWLCIPEGNLSKNTAGTVFEPSSLEARDDRTD